MISYVVGTPISDALHAEAETTIALLRSDAPRPDKVKAADHLIYGFVEAGIAYHFHGPAQLFGLSKLLVKVIDVASATTLRALQSATRRVLKNLSDEQLVQVADEIEARLYPIQLVEE